jgi:hypothetical protein
MERPDAAFMASYSGGEPEDYDALNAGTAVDGDTAAWTVLRTLTDDFEQLQQYVDLENYAEYMLLQFYGGNDWDWNTSQNWMAARKRETGAGWKFFSWDSDLMLRTGARANVVNRGGPGNLWGPISRHEEFRMLLADRAQKYFFHDGMLTPERVLSQFEELANGIRQPIVAETARWTGTNSTAAYTPETWEEQLQQVGTQIILERTEIVVDQMRRAGVFPDIDAPTFLVNAAPQHGGIIGAESLFAMSAPDGTVSFTLDGSDPRLPGGEVAPGASVFEGPLTLPSNVTVKARALHEGEWSALSEATYSVQSQSELRITEINYHPHPPNLLPGLGESDAESDSFEFIELTNVSDEPMNLAGVRLSEENFHGRNQGVAFQFSPQMLAAGEQIVVVRDRTSFQSRYGASVRIAAGRDGREGAEGEFGGELSNRAERITLLDAAGGTIHQFSYGTGEDWPQRANGLGSSLEIISADGNYNSAGNWRASGLFGGSPGTHGLDTAPSIVINEVLANPRPGESDRMELFNAGSQVVDIQNWYISNTASNYFRAQVTSPTIVPSRGYVVVDETQLGFDFDGARGDDVWLMAADESGRPRSFVDHVRFDNSAAGVSLGRWPSGAGEFFPMAEVTMGDLNSGRRISDVIISEIHFSPLDPDRERPQKPDDFEFIELYNRSDAVVDLSGLRLTGGVEFTFPPRTAVPPEDALVVVPFSPDNVGKTNVFRFILGAAAELPLLGPYDGQLNDEGDAVHLERRGQPPDDDPAFVPYIVIDGVKFGIESPWPGVTSGTGNSLTRIRPVAYGNDASSWTGRKASPGLVEFQPPVAGDANEDGQFDQRDVVLVLQGGKYLTGLRASWREGDFNADAVFDQEDIVAALQSGSYLQNSSAAYRGAGRGKQAVSTQRLDSSAVDGLLREFL